VADNYSESASPSEESEGGDSREKLLEEAKSRLKLSEDATQDERRLALEDLEFRGGKQWHAQDETARAEDGRPCLVINRIPQFIQQVTNDQRQNRPSIKVHAVDDKGDPETAKVIQGLIRHIEYDSNADVAYDTAFDSAATGGFGYFRIVTEYEGPLSFNQAIKIKRIRNPFAVFFDPYSQEPDGSDAKWAFIVEDISKEEYKAQFPNSELSKDEIWTATGNDSPEWVKDGHARIAEYFYKENVTKELVLLSDGTVYPSEEPPQNLPALLMAGVNEVRRRTAPVPVIKWCKLNGCEVLEETEWPGAYIPIVPVYGNELYINGKRILEGIVRHAKDAQRMLNYWKSAETEAIALAPRAPFVAAKGQIEGFEADWNTANKRNHAVLEYNPTALNGTVMPPPQRMAVEPAVMAITQASMGAAEDLKATTGIYDASLGGRSNETSGIAIQRRNQQAQTSNFHFIDNLTRSLRHAGRILVDLIPKIYDTARTARIIGDDDEQRVVRINDPEFVEKGEQRLYAMDAGKYDVTVSVGPSYASKRQEAVASMLELSKSIPAIGQAAPDLIVKSMDLPGAPELAERLKKTLPPGMADDPKGQKPLPPEAKAQMEQMGGMIEQLTGKVNELQSEREQKLLELESKERIVAMQTEAQVAIKLAELDHRDSLALLKNQIDEINRRQEFLRMSEPVDPEAGAPGPQDFAPAEEASADMSAAPEVEAFDPAGGSPLAEPMEQSDDDPGAY
jgi:hypothetical protein